MAVYSLRACFTSVRALVVHGRGPCEREGNYTGTFVSLSKISDGGCKNSPWMALMVAVWSRIVEKNQIRRGMDKDQDQDREENIRTVGRKQNRSRS
jgi:hypothetical protein